MSGHERSSRVIAEFRVPAVVEHKEWKYSGWRVQLTDTADVFLTRHLVGMVRS